MKEIKELKKELAPGYKTLEELLKSDINSLSDHELYRLIRHETPGIKNKPELTAEQLQKLTDEELKQIIEG